MAYYKKCPKCGAHIDPGEVCRCDCANERRPLPVSAPPTPTVIRIEQKTTLDEQARELDRVVRLAWLRYRAEKAEKKRRKKG